MVKHLLNEKLQLLTSPLAMESISYHAWLGCKFKMRTETLFENLEDQDGCGC